MGHMVPQLKMERYHYYSILVVRGMVAQLLM